MHFTKLFGHMHICYYQLCMSMHDHFHEYNTLTATNKISNFILVRQCFHASSRCIDITSCLHAVSADYIHMHYLVMAHPTVQITKE